MDNEQLKDIIVEDTGIAPIESDRDIIDIFESTPEPGQTNSQPLLTPQELQSNDSLTDQKKKLAAALAAAQDLGIIDEEKPYTAETLADTSDRLVEQLRQDYKAGTNEVSAEEAYENSLDRGAARLAGNINALIDNIVEKVGTTATLTLRVWADRVFDYIEEQHPELAAFRKAAEQVVDVLDHKIVPVIVAGARKVADKVKSVVEAATEKVSSVARKVTDFIKGLF